MSAQPTGDNAARMLRAAMFAANRRRTLPGFDVPSGRAKRIAGVIIGPMSRVTDTDGRPLVRRRRAGAPRRARSEPAAAARPTLKPGRGGRRPRSASFGVCAHVRGSYG
jgi:hypothetical protein